MRCALLILLTAGAFEDPPQRVPWPVSTEHSPPRVSNLFHAPLVFDQARGYLHGGIDVRAPARTPVLAVARGTVWIYREGLFDNLVLTERNGDSWEYRHLGADLVPPEILRAMEEGTIVEVGSVLGEIGPWGLGYTHLHFNRRLADGTITDPLAELLPLADSTSPQVREIRLAPAESSSPFPLGISGVTTVSGAVDIICEVADTNDAVTRFVHPPQSARALLITEDGSAIELTRWDSFATSLPRPSTLPVPRYPRAGLGAYRRVGPLALENPIPIPGAQRFWLVITSGLRGGWRTINAPDGLYRLRIVARDRSGNEGWGEIEIGIANESPPPRPPRTPPSALERELSRHGFTTCFRGDSVEHTFFLPTEWSNLTLLPPPGTEVISSAEVAGHWRVQVRIDTAGQSQLHRDVVIPLSAAGTSVTLTVTIEAHPLIEVASTPHRVRRNDAGGLFTHVRLRTPSPIVIGKMRWLMGERSGSAELALDVEVDPHCRVIGVAIPEEAIGGTLDIEFRMLGRAGTLSVRLTESSD